MIKQGMEHRQTSGFGSQEGFGELWDFWDTEGQEFAFKGLNGIETERGKQ